MSPSGLSIAIVPSGQHWNGSSFDGAGGGAEVSVSGAKIHGQRSIYSKRCPIPIRDRPPARLRIVPLSVAVRSMWPWLLNTEEHFQEIWAEIRSTVQ